MLQEASDFLEKAQVKGVTLSLPQDVRVVDGPVESATESQVVSVDALQLISRLLILVRKRNRSSSSCCQRRDASIGMGLWGVRWPLGQQGTHSVAYSSQSEAMSFVGGGDTLAATQSLKGYHLTIKVPVAAPFCTCLLIKLPVLEAFEVVQKAQPIRY